MKEFLVRFKQFLKLLGGFIKLLELLEQLRERLGL